VNYVNCVDKKRNGTTAALAMHLPHIAGAGQRGNRARHGAAWPLVEVKQMPEIKGLRWISKNRAPTR
jgi:hypothetical protein